MSVLVVTTGGTIGAMPYADIRRQPIDKTMPGDGTDVVRSVLEESFRGYDLRFITLKHYDSKFIDEAYRTDMAQRIAAAEEPRVLITHGTDTILVTAEFLYHSRERQPALRDKTLLLTGAMVALSCGAESDGFLNISFALNQLSLPLENGVYIVLCDYKDTAAQKGWTPRLYRFAPGLYGKTHDVENMHRDRLVLLNS